jgi:hypothetical protein
MRDSGGFVYLVAMFIEFRYDMILKDEIESGSKEPLTMILG